MTINKYTFFSLHGNDFPVTANSDGKLYMMLTGMNYNDFRLRHWTPALNTALNRVYTKTSMVVGGRYFELQDHSVTLKPAQTNFIHAVINVSNMDNPVTITVEDQDNTNSNNINDGTGALKVCFEQVVTSGSAVTSVINRTQNTQVDSIIATGTVDSGQVKTATINTGYGRSAVITRIGNTVTITSQNRHSSVPANGSWQRGVGTLPVGFRPVTEALVYNHDLTNASKFSWSLLHPNGVIDLFSNGNITTTDYILTSGQFWITKDNFPT